MRMKRDEKCIVPYCDVADESGAKPIYINVTVDGKRVWKKVGGLCEVHLPDLDTGDSTSSMMHWIMYTPGDDVNFIQTLQKAGLPFLRQALERLEDELRRGFPHKIRIKKVAARIRALEKELLRKDAEEEYDSPSPAALVRQIGGSVVAQVLPQKTVEDAELSVADWRAIHELGKAVLPRTARVHCDECGCDNVPDLDNRYHPVCGSCGRRLK